MDALIMLVWRYRVAQTIEIRDSYAKEIVLAIARDIRRFIAVRCHYHDADTKDVFQDTLRRRQYIKVSTKL